MEVLNKENATEPKKIRQLLTYLPLFTFVSSLIGGAYFFGVNNGKSEFLTEKSELIIEKAKLTEENKSLNSKIEILEKEKYVPVTSGFEFLEPVETYNQYFQSRTEDGKIPVFIEGIIKDNKDHFRSIWREKAGSYDSRSRLSTDQFREKNQELTSQGYTLIFCNSYYSVNGEKYVAATWLK